MKKLHGEKNSGGRRRLCLVDEIFQRNLRSHSNIEIYASKDSFAHNTFSSHACMEVCCAELTTLFDSFNWLIFGSLSILWLSQFRDLNFNKTKLYHGLEESTETTPFYYVYRIACDFWSGPLKSLLNILRRSNLNWWWVHRKWRWSRLKY